MGHGTAKILYIRNLIARNKNLDEKIWLLNIWASELIRMIDIRYKRSRNITMVKPLFNDESYSVRIEG